MFSDTSLRSSFDGTRENFAIENIEKRITVGVAGLFFQMCSLR